VSQGRQRIGVTPFQWRPPEPEGKATLVFRKRGYTTKRVRVRLRQGAKVHARLRRKPARGAPGGADDGPATPAGILTPLEP